MAEESKQNDSPAAGRSEKDSDTEASRSPEPIPVDPGDIPGNDPGAAPPVARQIPGYQILAKLGAGSMAAVFKARQLSLNRIVAIKVLPRQLSEDEEYVQRFYSEGRAAAKLNHPNIVGAYDVGEHGGYHYFVMEYVEGKTVDEELKAGKVYTDGEALSIILQVARALDHAHRQGLIHRDVKPKNIMITEDGTAKLMDMGLARVADDADAIKAESGRLFGTPYYISPEQILGSQDVDFRCDIYSLGATLYHMVTGQVPFEAEDAKHVMIKHVKEKPVSPDRHNIDISFGLCKTILQMMAKHKEHRYDATADLIEDLQSIDFMLEVEEDRPGPIPTVETKTSSGGVSGGAATPAAHPLQSQSQIVYRPNPLNTYLILGLVLSVLVNLVLILLLMAQ